MSDSKDSIKFWTILAGMFLGCAIAVMLIDISIKAAILDESNRLRQLILQEGAERGKADAGSDDGRDNHNGNIHSLYPVGVLDSSNAGMEAENVPTGDKTAPATTPRKTRTKRTSGDANS